ncbi:MAG: ABC transporter ATP-binding protein [bacterium]|nr:ABC transporter ATP-binding protein [bacterium]
MNDIKKSQKASISSVRHAFVTIVWPKRKLLLAGFVLIMINSAAGLVIPGSTKYLIDDIIPNKDTVFLKWLLLAVGGAICIQAATSFWLTKLLSVEAHNLVASLRVQMQKHIIYQPIQFFDNDKTGALVSRIMGDVEGVRNLIGTGLVHMVGGILTASVSLVILITINPLLTLYTMVPFTVLSLVFYKMFAFMRPIFRNRRKIRGEVTGRLTEAMNGIRVIKGFNAEQQEIKVFEKGAKEVFRNVKQTLTASSLVTSLTMLLMGLASLMIMWIGSSFVIDGKMTVGDLFAFTLYLGFLIAPVKQMSNIGGQLTEAFAGLDRMEEILALQKEDEADNRHIEPDEIKGDLSFENVYFAYEEGKDILLDISFKAPQGSVTALVGSSGSGKTTISGLVASFLKPQRGTIRIDGMNMAEVDLNSYRSRLGVVLQDDFLFDGTIRENILFSRPDATEEEFQQAMEAAHVKEFVDEFDKKAETVIGERGVKLSGGQRQRVAIARAILADPRVLILDEATSNLDTESESYIQKSLAHLMKGRTTIVIAHRLSTIRKADQILVIENGRIAERGTHDSLIQKEGRYFDLYTYQSRI